MYNGDDIIGFTYNNQNYYYIKNAQNDIIGILDNTYNKVVEYSYDSWGNIISITDNNDIDISNDQSHIANINPFRYRSYYYDKETNLYYLNSRYYNPTWGRFINADGTIGANDDSILNNLYAYCSNNPVNNTDEDGEGFFAGLAASVIAGAAVGVAGQLISDVLCSAMKGNGLKLSSWQTYVGAMAGGMVTGAGMYTIGRYVNSKAFSVSLNIMTNFLSGATSSLVTDHLTNSYPSKKQETVSKEEMIENAFKEGGYSVIFSGTTDTLWGDLDIFTPKKININQGRNSLKSIWKSGVTKLKNNTAKNMSMKVLSKGIIYQTYEDLFGSMTNGIRQYIKSSFESIEFNWDN